MTTAKEYGEALKEIATAKHNWLAIPYLAIIWLGNYFEPSLYAAIALTFQTFVVVMGNAAFRSMNRLIKTYEGYIELLEASDKLNDEIIARLEKELGE